MRRNYDLQRVASNEQSNILRKYTRLHKWDLLLYTPCSWSYHASHSQGVGTDILVTAVLWQKMHSLVLTNQSATDWALPSLGVLGHTVQNAEIKRDAHLSRGSHARARS